MIAPVITGFLDSLRVAPPWGRVGESNGGSKRPPYNAAPLKTQNREQGEPAPG